MCGIIAIVRQRSRREAPSSAEVLALLEGVPGLLATAIAEASGTADSSGLAMAVSGVAERVSAADLLLRGVPGVRALLADRALPATLDSLCDEGVARVADIEQLIDRDGGSWKAGTIEAVNAALIELRDALWALQRDRLRTAGAVGDLAGPDAGPAAIEAFMSVQQALSGIDRLEVRGRDSAGVHLLVRDHGLDLRAASIAALLEGRVHDPLFSSSSVRVGKGDVLSFVYKAAAEIGELGDNTRPCAPPSATTRCCTACSHRPTAQAVVLGHTRWASVGIISQPNAHPLNSDETDRTDGPYVVGALNGDVDNFADLKAAEAMHLATDITTDAKVIPTLVSRRLAGGDALVEAFRRSASVFEGSVAIGVATAEAPDRLALALRGSGQALYVGLAEDAFVVASEPYGLVEETLDYVRLDGETPANPANPTASRGQIMILDHRGRRARSRASSAWPTTAPPLPVSTDDVVTAEITTRDIDRRHFAHFLLKEISEAPSSFRKTLRGKLVERDGQAAGVARPRHAARRAARPPARRRASAGCWSSARAPRRSPARASPGPCSRRSRASTCASSPSPPPSCRASTCAPTCPTRSWSPSASRAPPPTPTAPSTWCGPAAPRWWPSSTVATATSPTRPTACSTRPTVATWR